MTIANSMFGRFLGVTVFTAAMGIGSFISPVEAGLNIQFGMSKGDIVRILQRDGYSQIQVHDKGFKTGRAYACKGGIKYDVKVDVKGRIKGTSKIGSCRNQVTRQQVRRNLEANGFTRIVIDEQNGNYVVIGCKNTQRSRVIISRQGQLKKRQNIGRCETVLAPSDVRQVLRDKGFNRIEFTDRQLPRYVAEACLKNRKLELVLNRFGEISRERRIGKCIPPIDSKNLAGVMREKGYDRVSIINAKPPRYTLEACYENARYDITLNRYGKITQRNRIGECNPAIREEQIAQLLRNEGFSRININQRGNGNFKVSACFEGYQKIIQLSQYGELLEEVDGKQCKIQSIREIRDTLNGRGFKRAKFYAEACRNGNKVRISLNQFGDRIGRKRIGSC